MVIYNQSFKYLHAVCLVVVCFIHYIFIRMGRPVVLAMVVNGTQFININLLYIFCDVMKKKIKSSKIPIYMYSRLKNFIVFYFVLF